MPAAAVSGVPTNTGTSWSLVERLTVGTSDSATLSGTAATSDLYVSAFGFDIPSTATILGVEVLLSGGPTQQPSRLDTVARLSLGPSAGALSSANRAQGVALTAYGTRVYGGPSDLWGSGLTPAIVNSSGFGFVFRMGTATAASPSTTINRIEIRVTYQVVEDGTARTTAVDAAAIVKSASALRLSQEYADAISTTTGAARVTQQRIDVIRSLSNGTIITARRRRLMFLVGD